MKEILNLKGKVFLETSGAFAKIWGNCKPVDSESPTFKSLEIESQTFCRYDDAKKWLKTTLKDLRNRFKDKEVVIKIDENVGVKFNEYRETLKALRYVVKPYCRGVKI